MENMRVGGVCMFLSPSSSPSIPLYFPFLLPLPSYFSLLSPPFSPPSGSSSGDRFTLRWSWKEESSVGGGGGVPPTESERTVTSRWTDHGSHERQDQRMAGGCDLPSSWFPSFFFTLFSYSFSPFFSWILQKYLPMVLPLATSLSPLLLLSFFFLQILLSCLQTGLSACTALF